jgi:putative ABC transport system permease protein
MLRVRVIARRLVAHPALPLLECFALGLAVTLLVSSIELRRLLQDDLSGDASSLLISTQLFSYRDVELVAGRQAGTSVSGFGKEYFRVATPNGEVLLPVYFVEPGFLEALQVPALLGATTLAPGSHRAVLSHSTWVDYFGSSTGVLQLPIRLNGHSINITGVAAPPSPALDAFYDAAVYVPWTLAVDVGSFTAVEASTVRWMNLVAKSPLQDGDLVGPSVTATTGAALGKPVEFRPLREYLLRGAAARRLVGISRMMLIIGACVALMALVSSANAWRRAAENDAGANAIKRTLGASTGRVMLDFGLEAAPRSLIAAAIAVVGLPLVHGALISAASGDQWAMTLGSTRMSMTAVLAAIGIATGFVVIAGLPAVARLGWQYARTEPANLLLSPGAPTGAPSPVSLFMSVLQVSTSIILASGAVLALDTLYRQMQRPLGFERGRVLVVRPFLSPKGTRAQSGQSMQEYLRSRFSELPDVEEASIATAAPFSNELFLNDIVRPDAPPLRVAFNVVGPSFLRVVGAQVLAGRTDLDRATQGEIHVVVNRSLVRALGLEVANAVGTRLTFGGGLGPALVIGIVEDGVYEKLTEVQWPTVFASGSGKWDPSSSLVLRLRDPRRGRSEVEAMAAKEVPFGRPVEIYSLDERADFLLARASRLAQAAAGLCVLSMATAALGFWTALAASVRRRHQVIAIRQMLGASPIRVLMFAGAEGAGVVIGGCALGALGTAVIEPFLRVFFEGARISHDRMLAIVVLSSATLNLLILVAVTSRCLRHQPAALLRD